MSVQTAATKIRCVKIRRPDSHGQMWCCVRLEHSLADEFDGAEPGERIEVEYCELTQEEFDALPEFNGW